MSLSGISTILVATDFSDASELALKAAIELAEGWRSAIELLHVYMDPKVVDMSPGGIVPVPVDVIEPIEPSRGLLEAAAGRVRRLGLQCGTNASRGKVHSEIVECARKVGAGLIAIATHERHGLGGVLSMSVAEKVVRHAPCPVLVIPVLLPGEAEAVRKASPIGTQIPVNGT